MNKEFKEENQHDIEAEISKKAAIDLVKRHLRRYREYCLAGDVERAFALSYTIDGEIYMLESLYMVGAWRYSFSALVSNFTAHYRKVLLGIDVK